MHICAQQVVVDNGVIKRGVDTSNGHIVTSHYVLQANDMGFLNGGSNEFSFLANGAFYSGRSEWTDIRSREVETADGGKGVLVSFKDRAGAFAVDHHLYGVSRTALGAKDAEGYQSGQRGAEA